LNKVLLIVLFLASQVNGQTRLGKLQQTVKDFHQAMVKNDRNFIRDHISSALSYGHSNGWIENSAEFETNLESGYMKYSSYKEDSMNTIKHKHVAHVRFIADINVTMNSTTGNYHLKVLEIWERRKNNWVLFARQAVK